jgi:hypothetical protein
MKRILKRVLIGIYLSCALVYFALNTHRITAEPYKGKTHERQASILAAESVLFPLFLAYYHLYKDGEAPPIY